MAEKTVEEIKVETVRKLQEVAQEWFDENFTDGVLDELVNTRVIASAEGFATSVMSELFVDMEHKIFGKTIS